MPTTLTGAGHRPARLGGFADPHAWRGATHVVAAHLEARLARAGTVELVVVPDDGYGLILGGAAQLLRNGGAPLGLRLYLPFAGHAVTLSSVAARSWHERLLARADAVVELVAEWPATAAQVQAWRLAAYERAIAEADAVVTCWDGRRGGTTAAVHEAACRAGKAPTNLYADVAAALGLAPGAWGRVARAPTSRTAEGAAAPWFGLRVD